MSHENFSKLALDVWPALLDSGAGKSSVLNQQCPSPLSLEITDEHAMTQIKLLPSKHMTTKGKKMFNTNLPEKSIISCVFLHATMCIKTQI